MRAKQGNGDRAIDMFQFPESRSSRKHPNLLLSRIVELRSRVAGDVNGSTAPVKQASPLWLRIGFWACILIAVAVVIRRVLAIGYQSRSAPPQMAALDKWFGSHAALTLAHIVPALFFVLVTPFFVFRKSSETDWRDYTLLLLGFVVGGTAYAMSRYSVGGWVERSAVLLFNTLFLYSLSRAYLYMRRGELVLKRRRLLRAIAILLGIAVTRPVMGIFFTTSPLTHLQPRQFFGVAFWIGFSTSTLIGESWLRRTEL